MEDEERNQILRDSHHQEFLAYGTIRIFEKRANRLKILRAWLTFLGIVLPVTIGGVYASFGQSKEIMKVIVLAAGIVGLIQLILSTWALVSGWDIKYESAVKSVQANTSLYNQWKRLCSSKEKDESEFLRKYNELSKLTETQELVDLAQHVSEREKRFAYRESLRYYSRECHDCKQTPVSRTGKKCSSCGQKKEKLGERKSKESS